MSKEISARTRREDADEALLADLRAIIAAGRGRAAAAVRRFVSDRFGITRGAAAARSTCTAWPPARARIARLPVWLRREFKTTEWALRP